MMNMENNDRFPIIPLDYKNRHLAYKKELMFDYKTGRLYVVSAEDKSVIFDITEQILNIVSSEVKADNLVVNIEGVGKVNLKKYVTAIKEGALHANTLTGQGCVGTQAYDFVSISNKDNIIQLHNFWKARPGEVPTVDENGVLVWSQINSFFPVKDVEVNESGIYILSNRYCQSTVDIDANLDLIGETPYSVISWKVTSGEHKPNFNVVNGKTVTLEYESDFDMPPNSTFIFTFESFDNGITWFESVKKYIQNNDKIDKVYMEEHYYDKQEVDEKLKWKDGNMNSTDD